VTDEHASHSGEQQSAEELLRVGASGRLGADLQPLDLRLPGGADVRIDGGSKYPPVLVEIYAHQGALKGSQPRKLAADAFKLVTVQRTVMPGARLALVLDDEVAAEQIRRGWLGEALSTWAIEVVVVPLDAAVREGLTAAQLRQRMVNPPTASDAP